MISSDRIRFRIYHTEGDEQIKDLELVIENAGRLVSDENILYSFNVFLNELREHGYDFELWGEDND